MTPARPGTRAASRKTSGRRGSAKSIPGSASGRSAGAAPGGAEVDGPEALTGTWVAEVEREGRPGYRIKLELEVMNDVLFGAVRYPTGRAGIHDAVIDGERISFTTTHTPQFESSPATIRFEGKIVAGEIHGVLQDGSGHARFTARRS